MKVQNSDLLDIVLASFLVVDLVSYMARLGRSQSSAQTAPTTQREGSIKDRRNLLKSVHNAELEHPSHLIRLPWPNVKGNG